ncbi:MULTISPECIES: hypothetical protein [Brevundimonas]|uniref:hypothetical protein n=1 Tax=Brevundimonas TaxID=41275 RepID=UPI001177A928|nr:hypothetical protein [Brevundimonas diminuta]
MSQAQRHARPLNRSESQARTRAALLDAAEALIVEHSIPALSLRAVCTRAGYTQRCNPIWEPRTRQRARSESREYDQTRRLCPWSRRLLKACVTATVTMGD